MWTSFEHTTSPFPEGIFDPQVSAPVFPFVLLVSQWSVLSPGTAFFPAFFFLSVCPRPAILTKHVFLSSLQSTFPPFVVIIDLSWMSFLFSFDLSSVDVFADPREVSGYTVFLFLFPSRFLDEMAIQ